MLSYSRITQYNFDKTRANPQNSRRKVGEFVDRRRRAPIPLVV